jgi:germination protein M
MGKNTSRSRPSFGVLFWIAAILLIAVLLMFNLPTIRSVLDNTDFVEVVFEERSSGSGETGENEAPAPPTDLTETAEDGTAGDPAEEDGINDNGAPPDEETDVPEAPAEQPGADETEEIVLAPPVRQEETGPARTIRGTLYFIRVSDDGRILAEPVTRTIRYDSGPLTGVLNALIAGPTAEDLNNGLLSLLPQGTELLSARVASGVAFLSFNEDFRFNSMGLEGLLAQLQQVVLTATQFSTVDAVQILIDGRTVDYLGGDGVYVGRPLTAQDLRN